MKGHNWGLCKKCGKDHGTHPQKNKQLSLERRKKISESLKGYIPWNKGKHVWLNKKHPMLGKHHSKETKERWKITHSHPSHRKRLSIEQEYGEERAKEIRKKISETRKKQWKDPEFRQRALSKNPFCKRRQLTDEERRKKREYFKEYWSNPQNRRRQSRSSKKLWKNPEYRENQLKLIRSRNVRSKISKTVKRLWSSGAYDADWRSPIKTTKPQYFTSIESEMRHILEKNGLKLGLDFLHNKKIGRYYPDFVFPSKKLIIECDGEPWHKEAHLERETYLNERGYRILRFKDSEILSDDAEEIILQRLSEE